MSVRDLIMAAASSSPAYRYWRIYVIANNGDANYIGYDEIELRGSVGGSDLTNASTPTTASTYDPSGPYPASSTVDNNTSGSTQWLSDIGQNANQWARYDLLTPKAVLQVAILPVIFGSSRAPKNFIVQGSNDGTVFKDIKTFSGITAWTNNTFNLFNLD